MQSPVFALRGLDGIGEQIFEIADRADEALDAMSLMSTGREAGS